MSGARTSMRALDGLQTVGSADLDSRSLRVAFLEILRQAINFDAYLFLLTDPVSTVGSDPLAEVPCLGELPALIKSRYATRLNPWTVLQQEPTPVGLLSVRTAGKLSESLVWREVMSRYGIGDVASTVLADPFGCWAFLDLWRSDTRTNFDESDAHFLLRQPRF